mmetsp:Transcript_26611/g.61152  ORF Transcript_26611/g.61152 Transcript_26611/m.61152 type:complete len:209 (-) Transcript_26611:208-834(-)
MPSDEAMSWTVLSGLAGIGLSAWCYSSRLCLLGVLASHRLQELLADTNVVPCLTIPVELREASCSLVQTAQWSARILALHMAMQLPTLGCAELAKVMAGFLFPDLGLVIWQRCRAARKSFGLGAKLNAAEVERLQQENLALRQEVAALRDERAGTCTMCLEALCSCVFLPCSHVCCCQACASRLCEQENPLCPLCRQLVENRLDAFLA